MNPDLKSTSYQVVYDPEVDRRLNSAAMRMFWKQWTVHVLKVGLGTTPVILGTWAIVSHFTKHHSFAAIGYSLLIFVIGRAVIELSLAYIKGADVREYAEYGSEKWQCEVSERGWSFTALDGTSRFIPWNVMSIVFEHPEGWYMQVSQFEELWVYRGPLKKAGLDEYFRSQIGKEPAS